MNLAEKALKDEGYDVVQFDITPEEYSLARDSVIAMVVNGTCWDLSNDFDMNGEKLTIGVHTNMLLMKAGPILRVFINMLLKAIGMGRTVVATKNVEKMSSHDYDNVMRKRYEFAYKFSEKWQKAGVSAIVTPAFPHCAFKSKHADDMGLMLEYIFIWSVLYYPAGIVPVTTVAKDEQVFTDSYNDGWTKLIDETAKGSQGMPIGVQVIAHTYEDEKALAVM
jgi:Asp-tRNA(Asn)/Glu-tRNA(Gln) amidotransferase A subunit family amidase